jgi:small subunit ribosomal protein S16
MLAIRLSRIGSKRRPFFRVVVSDAPRARDSRFVEILGHYDPRATPAVVDVNHERVAHWLKAGARPSDTVRTLLARHVTNPPAAAAPETPAPAPEGEAPAQ